MENKYHIEIDNLTNHDNRWKRCNTAILDGYAALHPQSLPKLCIIIFNMIIEDNEPDPSSVKAGGKIYSTIPVYLENLLERCYPVKYGVEKKDMKSDFYNLSRRLQELHDNNIFYIWKLGKPYIHMFFMERNISLWKYFNPSAVIIPKTIKKILKDPDNVVATMKQLLNSNEPLTDMSTEQIYDSFLNDFISPLLEKYGFSQMIDKNNVETSSRDIILRIKERVYKMDDYHEATYDPSFLLRLPKHLSKYISSTSLSKTYNEIIPSNGNMVPVEDSLETRKRDNKKQKDAPPPKRKAFESMDLFSNCLHFIKFYRLMVTKNIPDAVFYPSQTERKHATDAMDSMIINKCDNVDSLIRWINYYSSFLLQKNKYKNKEYTSIKAFNKTFKEFNKTMATDGK
jgi:hypothetical protein